MCIVTNSLKTYKFSDVFDISVCGAKVFPEQNKKLFHVLEQKLNIESNVKSQRQGWQHFRLGGYQRKAVYVLLLMKTAKSKVGSIRCDYIKEIVQKASATLDSKCRSRLYNSAHFSWTDRRKILRIFKNDWIPLVESMEKIMTEESFNEKHGIVRMFFYSCVHGIQNSHDDVRTLFSQMEVVLDYSSIELVQIHVATNISSAKEELLLVQHGNISKLLRTWRIQNTIRTLLRKLFDQKMWWLHMSITFIIIIVK